MATGKSTQPTLLGVAFVDEAGGLELMTAICRRPARTPTASRQDYAVDADNSSAVRDDYRAPAAGSFTAVSRPGARPVEEVHNASWSQLDERASLV